MLDNPVQSLIWFLAKFGAKYRGKSSLQFGVTSMLLWHSPDTPEIRCILQYIHAAQYRHLQLALLLLTELKQGTRSKWHPYIAALPTSVHTLLHWTEEELKDLQYSTSEHEQRFLLEV